MKNRNIWCMDIETIRGIFTYSAINIDTLEIVSYVIHRDKFELQALMNHLRIVKIHVGFNNVDFDYPILHHIILKSNKWLHEYQLRTIVIGNIIQDIYNKAQNIINTQTAYNNYSFKIKEKNYFIKQIDLYKLWHFNNPSRSTSLKALEIAMNFPNVMEMPIHHTCTTIGVDSINSILKYNINDVLATFEFYKLSIDKLNLRINLNFKYNIGCLNFPDSKLGETLVLKLYCDKTGADYYETKKLRTHHSSLSIKDCIFDYIKFNTKEFNDSLETFKNYTISKEDIEENDNSKKKKLGSCVYKGFKYDFGLGGIHGCVTSGVYEYDNEYVIIDADVNSEYPFISINNGLYPKHLGPIFSIVYKEDIVYVRIAAKKSGDMIISDGFKLGANAIFGKSKDKHSFLYDMEYFMKTTINGQLLVSMLCEKLTSKIESILMLQVNTDGITVKIKKTDLELYYSICKEWETATKLTLEYVEYSKMIIMNVNNYIAVSKNGKIKYKGSFEINKELHKDNSFKIIPIALSEYFINKTPISETINNHKNIYDFCGRQKFKGEDFGETRTIVNNKLEIKKEQKNVRYFISNTGSLFVKKYNKGSEEAINKGFIVTIFNKFYETEFKNYNINYKFYEIECNKVINIIENNQLKLF